MTVSAEAGVSGERPPGAGEAAPARAGEGRPATQGRVPDFFIVGHPKCGTTALYEMLRRHPQIYMPERKEPRFFATDVPSPFRSRRSGAPAEGLSDYLALFAPASEDQLLGEASTAYIWSHTAAGLIAEAQPRARIIAVLREPASLLRSLHLQLLQHRSENEADLRKAIALEEQRRHGAALPRVVEGWPQVLMYTDRVRYLEQLRRYEAAFPPEQMLVLIYDDLRADNVGTVRAVQRFLGVDDSLPVEVMQVNRSVRMRSVRLDEMVQAVTYGQGRAGRAALKTVKLLTPRRARHRALELIQRRVLFGRPRAPDEELMLELRRRFTPEVEALSEHLGRDLVALWGYDRLG